MNHCDLCWMWCLRFYCRLQVLNWTEISCWTASASVLLTDSSLHMTSLLLFSFGFFFSIKKLNFHFSHFLMGKLWSLCFSSLGHETLQLIFKLMTDPCTVVSAKQKTERSCLWISLQHSFLSWFMIFLFIFCMQYRCNLTFDCIRILLLHQLITLRKKSWCLWRKYSCQGVM